MVAMLPSRSIFNPAKEDQKEGRSRSEGGGLDGGGRAAAVCWKYSVNILLVFNVLLSIHDLCLPSLTGNIQRQKPILTVTQLRDCYNVGHQPV